MADTPIRAESQLSLVPGRDDDAAAVIGKLAAAAKAAGIASFAAAFSGDHKTINVSFDAPNYPTFESNVVRLGPILAQFDGVAAISKLHVTGPLEDRMRAALGRVTPHVAFD